MKKRCLKKLIAITLSAIAMSTIKIAFATEKPTGLRLIPKIDTLARDYKGERPTSFEELKQLKRAENSELVMLYRSTGFDIEIFKKVLNDKDTKHVYVTQFQSYFIVDVCPADDSEYNGLGFVFEFSCYGADDSLDKHQTKKLIIKADQAVDMLKQSRFANKEKSRIYSLRYIPIKEEVFNKLVLEEYNLCAKEAKQFGFDEKTITNNLFPYRFS